MADFYSVINNRHSVRQYEDRPVEKETLMRLLAAANKAPSAHNGQPWHFFVLASGEARQRAMRAAAKAYRRDLKAARLDDAAVEKKVEESVSFFSGVPVLLLAFSTGGTGKAPPAVERILSIQSTSAAITQLLLATEAEGLGGCWYSLALYCQKELAAFVNAPEPWEAMGLITLGYEAGHPPLRQKKEDETLYTFVL